MSEKESYISNSVSSQDDMQDMTILNPFVFYDTQDGEIASSAFQIHFATNFGKENGPNKVTEVFDKYSDFYIDKKDFKARGGSTGSTATFNTPAP